MLLGDTRLCQRRCLTEQSSGTTWKQLAGAVTEEDTSPGGVRCFAARLPVMWQQQGLLPMHVSTTHQPSHVTSELLPGKRRDRPHLPGPSQLTPISLIPSTQHGCCPPVPSPRILGSLWGEGDSIWYRGPRRPCTPSRETRLLAPAHGDLVLSRL